MSNTILLGVLRTRPIQDHNSPNKEIGQFELEVRTALKPMLTSGDVRGYMVQQISIYLASAVRDTQVPTEYWQFVTNPKVAREYNFHSVLDFGGNG